MIDDLTKSTAVGSSEKLTLAFFVLCLAFIVGSQAGITGSTGADGINTSLTINAVSYEVTNQNMSRKIPIPTVAGGQDYGWLYLVGGFSFLIAALVLLKKKWKR